MSYLYPHVYCSLIHNIYQFRCLSTEDCIKKMWYADSVQYYSIIKIKTPETLSYETKWILPDTIITNEMSAP